MKKFVMGLVLISILALTGCNVPGIGVSAAAPGEITGRLMTPDPNATPTATPFLPGSLIPITEGAAPTGQPTRPASTPTRQPTTPPTPPAFDTEGLTKILVLGSDWRPNAGFRTDVIMLVLLDTRNKTSSVISFPRDLYVEIPGWMTQRINTAFPYGGFDLMADTLDYNFGIRPDYYIMTNFQGFQEIVDSLGGIKVNTSRNLTDQCSLPAAVEGNCSVGPGLVHMDGPTALWYVRSRYSSSDFDRTRRAQEVMYGLFARLMELDAIPRIPELYQAYSRSVETNLNVGTVGSLAGAAPALLSDASRINRYAVGPQHVSGYVTESGAQVLLPNFGAIHDLIQLAISDLG